MAAGLIEAPWNVVVYTSLTARRDFMSTKKF